MIKEIEKANSHCCYLRNSHFEFLLFKIFYGSCNLRQWNIEFFDCSNIYELYTIILRNKFDALQEISETPTPNDKYENFVNGHLEVAAEFIPTKQRAKLRVPWDTLALTRKSKDVKIASLDNRMDPTNINSQKLKKAQNELTNVYLKEQTEYIQNQINKIRDSAGDR